VSHLDGPTGARGWLTPAHRDVRGSPGSEVRGLQEGPPSAPVRAMSKSGLWHLCGVPLLKALQSVGVLGADVPANLDRAVSMNIYISGPPATLLRGAKVLDIPLKWTSSSFWGSSHGHPSSRKKRIGKPGP